jgi:hypothetical protein
MEDKPGGSVTPSRRQKAFAAAVAAVTVAYLLLAISGTIHPVNRLTAADFGAVLVAALVIGAILRPDFFERVQKFDFAGLKFELGEMKKDQIEVQKRQQEQLAILDDVRLALRLLIGKNEQDHLLNLFKHSTDHYRVEGSLRDEIRRLRAMRLVKMREARSIAGMPENATFDLADYVELTDDGLKFAARVTNQPGVEAEK